MASIVVSWRLGWCLCSEADHYVLEQSLLVDHREENDKRRYDVKTKQTENCEKLSKLDLKIETSHDFCYRFNCVS